MPGESSHLPLAGLTILSLAEQYPGPYATLVLGDLGARVILVERPTGDPSRANPAFFASLNRGKESVALDLRSAAGREAFLTLAASADALVEGFRPGVMARLGLSHEELHELNPGLVYVSISGFGQSGPYAARPGHDLSFQALAGMLHDRDAEGEAPWLSLGNLASGTFAVIGVLAGLVSRSQTGRGSYVDLAILDSLVSLMTAHLVPLLQGAPDAHVPPEPAYGLFATADGRVLALSIYGEDAFWRSLCEAAGLPRVAGLSMPERLAREPELRVLLADAIRARPYEEWASLLERDGIPFAPVNELGAVLTDPQVAARRMVVDVSTSSGAKQFVRQPLQFDGMGPGPRSDAPELGADTERVLTAAGCPDDIIHDVLAAAVSKAAAEPEGGHPT